MAEHKVVNTTQLEADLTAVANAIRAKAESSGSLNFPSGFVDAIANLATGGGLPSEVTHLASGTFTLTSSNTTQYTITHGMGTSPNFYIVMVDESLDTSTDGTYKISMIMGVSKAVRKDGSLVSSGYSMVVSTSSQGYTTNGQGNFGGNSTTINTQTASGRYFAPNKRYNWVCGYLDS